MESDLFSFLKTLKETSAKFKKSVFDTWCDASPTGKVNTSKENSNAPGLLRQPRNGPPERTGRKSAKAIPPG